MSDLKELLKEKIRAKRKELQSLGNVNQAFSNDNSDVNAINSGTSGLEREEDEAKSMIVELEKRRKRRARKLFDEESDNISHGSSDDSKNMELAADFERIKETVAQISSSRKSSQQYLSENNESIKNDQEIESEAMKKPPEIEINSPEKETDPNTKNSSESKLNSYREKIRNRMNKAKSIGQSQVTEDKPNEQSRRMSTARQLELDKREEEEINTKLEERKLKKERLRRQLTEAAEISKPVVPITYVEENVNESYDFFAKEYEEEDKVTSETSVIHEESTADNQESAESAKLLKDYLTRSDQEELVKYAGVQYIPLEKRLEREKSLFLYPSFLPAPLQDKIDGEAPRMAENEGLFVGEKPKIAKFNLNKIENRILKSDNSKSWFGEDGFIKSLPDPLEKVPVKHFDAEGEIPGELVPVFKKAILPDVNNFGKLENRHQLNVNVASCVFVHHPLFSREHVLAKKLQTLHNRYSVLIQEDKISYLSHKLSALRVAAANINIDDAIEAGDTSSKIERLKSYRNEIRSVRVEKERAEILFRKVSRSILRVWKAIKRLREKQQYINTSIKLIIYKKNTDADADKEAWDTEIENEIKDLKDEANDRYSIEILEYEQKLNEWKSWMKKYKEAKRKEKASKKSPKHEEEKSEEDKLSLEEEDILYGEKKEKPIPPEKIDTEVLFENVKEKALRIRRHPGEPLMQFELVNTTTITASEHCPKSEQQRRNEMTKRKIFLKVLVNEKVVDATNPRSLNLDFNITIGHCLFMKVIQWVREIKVQIFEVGSYISGPSLLTEVFLPVPDISVTSYDPTCSGFEFSNNDFVQCNHAGVGAGIEFSDDCLDASLTLLTNGEIFCSTCWEVDSSESEPGSSVHFENLKRTDNMLSAFDTASNVPDLYKLVDWVKKSNLDPNDPSNASLLHLIKTLGCKGDMGEVPKHFRLDHEQEEFNFVSDKDVSENLRFRMIRMRESDKIPEFKNYRMIPLKDKEIPKELFDVYDRRLRAKKRSETDDDSRHRVTKYLAQVREQVFNRFKQVQHKKSVEDIITEDEVPDISTLGINLLALTNKRRPLKPVRKDRKKVTSQNVGGAEVKMVINIGRAMDLPKRSLSKEIGRNRQNQSSHGHLKDLRPFVEVMFQRQVKTTSVADGPNPTWNTELQFDFKAPHDNYSPSNLESIRDVIYFNVFDEVMIDLLEDDRNRDTDLHRRMEKRFLGSFHLPFSTVYFNSKIEGTFELKVPDVLFGYEKSLSQKQTGNLFEVLQSDSGSINSFLTIYVTMEPSLPSPEVFREKFESNESEKLLDNSRIWQSDLLSKFPKRNVKTTVIDLQGKTVFITRFFRSVKPPAELIIPNNEIASSERVARFVSLIPSVSDSAIFPGLCDLWSTSEQFLQMLTGDEEEHAVLLCNYFNNMNKQAWLAVGYAVPEGPTAYVLTKESADIWVWNASNGNHSSIRDSYNALQSIGCVINQDNIWANIQKNSKPSLMSFDFNSSSDWKPFFNRSNPNPGIRSIQTENLPYYVTDDKYVKDVKDKIENKLRENFSRWRTRAQVRTRWNRHCKQVLADILPLLEESTWNRNANLDRVSQEINGILNSFSMNGFPIQMPYTDVETVVEAVYATGVHLNKSVDVEFALAVYVHPYPCNVLAVWVYIASLVHL